jgi:16S rRNA (guanine527-N7)-methyltransferase
MAIEKSEIIKEIEKFCPLNGNIVEKLEKFVDLLLIHNLKYNLIGKSTIEDIWSRHILDSAQLIKFIPNKSLKIGDFGSGAGLPAIILSILGVKEIHLIEKSFRKCEFLEIARKVSNNRIVIHQEMVQNIKPIKFDLITSRAFAPLQKLLEITKPFVSANTIAIFPKGKNITNELNLVKTKLDYKILPSLTSSEGNILIINKF